MYKIAPSILAADFANLSTEITALDDALNSEDYIHLDIMDGNFVPNLTFGAEIVKSIRKYTKKQFDVHLMVNNPENYITAFQEAGANIITFHYEATKHHDSLLSKIKSLGLKTGIALNPSTPEDSIKYLLNKLDLILIMTVNPGFGGQTFIERQLEKITRVKTLIKNYPNLEIEVDGGITQVNALAVKQAGAKVLVAGSSVFKDKHYKKNIALLR